MTASAATVVPVSARDQLISTWLSVNPTIGAKYVNKYGILIRLPPARKLVRIWNRHDPRLGEPMRYAATVAGVKARGVVYVIGSGSSSKKLELAIVESDGKRYTLRTTVGAAYHPKFGTG